MADLKNLTDMHHWWGSDLSVSETGDLATVTKTDRGRQRVLRRLMTPSGGYLSHTDYGAGLPQYVGQNAEPAKIKTKIKGQMKLESAVSQTSSDAPTVSISSSSTTLAAEVSFTVAQSADPAVLSFKISE